MTRNQEIANTILQQLGGANRLVMMTGAYNFVAIQNGLSFKIKNPKANYIKITLNGKDLYDLEVGRIRGNSYKVVSQYDDLYFDMLKPSIEKATGMYLSLFEKGGVATKVEDLKDAIFLMRYNNLIYADGKWKNTGKYGKSVNASANQYFTQESVNKLADRLNDGGVSKQTVLDYLKSTTDNATYKYWSERFRKGGSVGEAKNKNANYLDGLPSDKKSRILKNIAAHYSISVADAEDEVRDEDAEMLYEYIANDKSLRMEVYNDMERGKMAKGGSITDKLDKVREKVNNFLNPLGYSARVEKSIGDVLYIIDPSTQKVGNKRKDFFDGMQILAFQDGSFEVSEYMAGANEDELHIYKETNSLNTALKELIKGNKRKPIKKYAKGGITEHGLKEGDSLGSSKDNKVIVYP
jgi:hypothetical protein